MRSQIIRKYSSNLINILSRCPLSQSPNNQHRLCYKIITSASANSRISRANRNVRANTPIRCHAQNIISHAGRGLSTPTLHPTVIKVATVTVSKMVIRPVNKKCRITSKMCWWKYRKSIPWSGISKGSTTLLKICTWPVFNNSRHSITCRIS